MIDYNLFRLVFWACLMAIVFWNCVMGVVQLVRIKYQEYLFNKKMVQYLEQEPTLKALIKEKWVDFYYNNTPQVYSPEQVKKMDELDKLISQLTNDDKQP